MYRQCCTEVFGRCVKCCGRQFHVTGRTLWQPRHKVVHRQSLSQTNALKQIEVFQPLTWEQGLLHDDHFYPEKSRGQKVGFREGNKFDAFFICCTKFP